MQKICQCTDDTWLQWMPHQKQAKSLQSHSNAKFWLTLMVFELFADFKGDDGADR